MSLFSESGDGSWMTEDGFFVLPFFAVVRGRTFMVVAEPFGFVGGDWARYGEGDYRPTVYKLDRHEPEYADDGELMWVSYECIDITDEYPIRAARVLNCHGHPDWREFCERHKQTHIDELRLLRTTPAEAAEAVEWHREGF